MGICGNTITLQTALKVKAAATTGEWIMEKRKITGGAFSPHFQLTNSQCLIFFSLKQKRFQAWSCQKCCHALYETITGSMRRQWLLAFL